MYFECRHIMHNGARCHSPALRDQHYCYYHTRFHSLANPSDPTPEPEEAEPLKLPALETRTAIQVAVSLILDALASSRIDRHDAGIYLYGLQVASQNVDRKVDILPFKAVEAVYLTPEGEELAPKLRVCEEWDKCANCELKETCRDFDPDQDEDEDES
jgi:hypothetical protein